MIIHKAKNIFLAALFKGIWLSINFVTSRTMPEGPLIVTLKEAVSQFKAELVVSATGNTKAFDPAY